MVKRQLICSDWRENLHMYNLEEKYYKEILNKFPKFDIKFINCEGLDLYDSNASIYFGNRVSEKILNKMPLVKWVHFGSIGIEKLSKEFISQRKLTITNSRGTIESAVASSAISMMFAFSRGLNLLPTMKDEKNFNRSFVDEHFYQFSDVLSEDISVLGYGPIAQTFIKMISGFSGNIKVITRTPRTNLKNIQFYSFDDYKKCLKKSKFVVNFLPHNDRTKNYVNKNFIQNIDADAYYINVGRHTTNDEGELLKSVKSKKIIGVGLDVYDKENFFYKEMLKDKNFILTPHIAAISHSFWKKQIKILLKNLASFETNRLSEMTNLLYINGNKV